MGYMKKMAKLTGQGLEDIKDDGEDDADDDTPDVPADPDREPLALSKVGCFYSENFFSDDKKYGGGASGAQASLALDYADDHSKNFVAISRVASDGHSFAFNSLKPGADKVKISDKGCKLPCLDDHRYQCGCADASCGDLSKHGEEHLRRWVVYKVLDEAPQPKETKKAPKKGKKGKKGKKNKKKGKKGKKGKKKKSEL